MKIKILGGFYSFCGFPTQFPKTISNVRRDILSAIGLQCFHVGAMTCTIYCSIVVNVCCCYAMLERFVDSAYDIVCGMACFLKHLQQHNDFIDKDVMGDMQVATN